MPTPRDSIFFTSNDLDETPQGNNTEEDAHYGRAHTR